MRPFLRSGYGWIMNGGCRHNCTVFVLVVIVDKFEGLDKDVQSACGFHVSVRRRMTEEGSGDVR